MIKVKVEHFNAWCEEEELLTSGTVGLEVAIEFSPDWEELIPHVVFSNGEEELASVIKNGKTVVPWEVMEKPKHNLRMGVRGLNENGSIVIPTVYADLGQIQLGTKDTTDEGREATPSLVGQITNIAQNAEDIAQSVRDDADAGKFDGTPGKSPYVGENGNWFVWDNASKKFVDTGVHAQGEQGLEGKPLQAFAVCYDEAAPDKTAPNKWYIPKTMPRPSGEVGLMVDVYWVNGKLNDLGYDVQLIWGEPGGADNEVIVDTAGTTDKLTGSHSIPTEGTVRYVLTEANGRKRWEYVSGELIPTQFSTDTAADVANKVVPGLSLEYLPGMEIYVQLDKGNTAELMSLVDDNGVSLPVYGNGTGATTGTIPTGYILHLKNAGDHWQIINSGGSSGGGGDVSKAYVDNQDKATLDSAKAYADGKLVTIDIETRGENSFWTDPLTKAQEIIDMVNAGKEVRLHFYDTITNTGDQLYPYETTDAGVPIFRRNIITADKASRINIKVQYNGEVKFEDVNYSPASKPATATELGSVKAKPATARQVTPIGIDKDGFLRCDTGLMSISDSGAVISSDCVSDYTHEVECKVSGITDLTAVTVTRTGANTFGGDKLADKLAEYGGTISGDEVQFTPGQVSAKTIFDKFAPHTQYTFLFFGKNSLASSDFANLQVKYTDGTKDTIKFATKGDFSWAKLVSNPAKTIKSLIGASFNGVTTLKFNQCGIFYGNVSESDFVEYEEQVYTPAPDGTVEGMTSLSPNMTILTDTPGVNIEATYLADSALYYKGKFEAVNAELQNAVTYEALDDALSRGVNSI